MVRAPPARRRIHRWTLAFAIAAAVTHPAAANAGEGRVVVIDVEPRVADALVVALSPWSLTIVRAPGPGPAADLDSATSRARDVASEQHAGAVVWIAAPRAPDEQATLWVYDAQTKQLAVRPLAVWAPFDDAGAASVALSVKTILRASPLVTQETAPDEAPVVRAPAAPALAEEAPLPPHATWRFESLVGARAPTGAGAAVEPRAALGASVWPAPFGGHAGVGLNIQAGPGVSVETGAFQGELREGSLEATARLRTLASRWVAFELEGGPALYLTSLEGQTLSTSTHLNALRLDPALDVGAVADVVVSPRVALGLLLDGAALLRFQRYALDGSPLLNEPVLIVLGGLRLSVEVD